ncbi:MAG: glycoside hydrolase family 57 protein [Acidobacteriota bacterium]
MVKLALLWHMHQPWYVEPDSGRLELPWVRTHSIKDYYGMAKLLEEFTGIKATFNLVPSLLRQIELYLEGRQDSFQEIFAKDPPDMTKDETRFLVNNFFSVNYDNHISPFPGYVSLHRKMSDAGGEKYSGDWKDIFLDSDLLDLQVWFSLTNIDQYYRENDDRIKNLIKKGKEFNKSDKEMVSSIELEIMGKIIPLYKELWERGNLEISTTPYYHPILPLLIDPQSGRAADPSLPEYGLNFNWKEDAESQVSKGLDYMKDLFGRRPDGIWPSEGSLSEDVLELLEKRGVKWTATDEKIIEKSLSGSDINSSMISHAKFKPWTFRGGDMRVFFRDNYLSDLIGFHYKNWDQKSAAFDLYKKIESAGEGVDGDIVLPVILDGENAWEFYKDSGREFLREFYSLIESGNTVDMISFSEACLMPAGDLRTFSPGSWINGNFNIWIGHEDDRRGWGLINLVKRMIGENKDKIPGDLIHEIMENIYIAEGSDWFWWYGTENHTDDLDKFDILFRKNLIKACTLAGLEVPAELGSPVFEKVKTGEDVKVVPDRYLAPEIDGKETSVYEWDGAGEIETGNMASAIYISHPVFRKIKYCFDKKNLYLNIEMKKRADFYISEKFLFELEIENNDIRSTAYFEHGDHDPLCFFGSILECRIPFHIFEGKEGDELKVRFIVKKNNEVYTKFPAEEYIVIRIPTERDYAGNWTL